MPEYDELPFSHLDEVVHVELRASTYKYGGSADGVGIQLTLESQAHIVAGRLPRDPARRLAMAILAAVEDDPEHVIDIRADGWTVKHPLACRPKLFDCPINRAAERDLIQRPDMPNGQYVCALDAAGRLQIHDRKEP